MADVKPETAEGPQIDEAVRNACVTVIAAERSIERTAVTGRDVAEFWASLCEARRLRAAAGEQYNA